MCVTIVSEWVDGNLCMCDGFFFFFFFFLLYPSHSLSICSKEYWMATVDNSACYDSSVSRCVFYLSFCHPVSPSINSNCYGSSVCQIGTYSDENRALSMGAYANFTQFHESEFCFCLFLVAMSLLQVTGGEGGGWTATTQF